MNKSINQSVNSTADPDRTQGEDNDNTSDRAMPGKVKPMIINQNGAKLKPDPDFLFSTRKERSSRAVRAKRIRSLVRVLEIKYSFFTETSLTCLASERGKER